MGPFSYLKSFYYMNATFTWVCDLHSPLQLVANLVSGS